MPLDLPQWPDKDPSDILDFQLSFADNLPADDPIVTVVWNMAPVGLTKHSQAHSGRTAIITLGGGVAGATYRLTADVWSSNLFVQRSVKLFVRDL